MSFYRQFQGNPHFIVEDSFLNEEFTNLLISNLLVRKYLEKYQRRHKFYEFKIVIF